MDEVLGAWKPYDQVLCNAVERSCKRSGIAYVEAEGRRFYRRFVLGAACGRARAARARGNHFPRVILLNAMNEQIHSDVEKLGAPFHAVYTAQRRRLQAGLQAFDNFDELGSRRGRAARLGEPAL